MNIFVGILIGVCGLLLGALIVMALLIWFSAKLAEDPDFDADLPGPSTEEDEEIQHELEEWS